MASGHEPAGQGANRPDLLGFTDSVNPRCSKPTGLLMIDSKQMVTHDRATASRNRRTGAVSSGNATPPAGTSATAAGLLNPPNAMAYNSLSKGPSGSRIRPEVPASQPMSPLGLGYFTFVRRRWPSGPAKPATSAVRASRQIRSSSPGVICERSSTAASPSHSA